MGKAVDRPSFGSYITNERSAQDQSSTKLSQTTKDLRLAMWRSQPCLRIPKSAVHHRMVRRLCVLTASVHEHDTIRHQNWRDLSIPGVLIPGLPCPLALPSAPTGPLRMCCEGSPLSEGSVGAQIGGNLKVQR